MRRVRALIEKWFEWDATLEWTAESNPASLTGELCERWRDAGVSRLSVGVQSFDDAVLRWLGRLHDAAGAQAALTRARAAGFENINLDLIFGLPADLDRDWEAEVRATANLAVTHVSTYGLTAEPRTALGKWVKSGRVRMPDDDSYGGEYLAAAAALSDAGYVHYEVSNFAKPAHECRHNWQCWEGAPYLGLGPSANSYLGGCRFWNVYGWEAYRKAAREGGSLREGGERLTPDQSALERVWLALRTRSGLPIDDPVWGASAEQGAIPQVWAEAGWLVSAGGRARLTPEGWLRMDALVAELGWRLEE
jgi:oxygen-independent coproporphyrinogen-3 oxidase